MIEELLKILYPAHHGLASDNVRVDYKLKSGIVELSDAKACMSACSVDLSVADAIKSI